MSSVASVSTTSTTSSTVTIPFTRRSPSTTGTARMSCWAITRATASWSISSGTVMTSSCITSRTSLSAGARKSSRNETTPSRRWAPSST